MTSKQLVYEEIKRRTLENNIEENEIFTANDLATWYYVKKKDS